MIIIIIIRNFTGHVPRKHYRTELQKAAVLGKTHFEEDTDFLFDLISNTLFCTTPLSDERQRKYLTEAYGKDIL